LRTPRARRARPVDAPGATFGHQPPLATQARVPQTPPVKVVARGTPRTRRARPVDAPCKKWGFVQLYRYFSGFYTIPHPAVQARKRPTTALAATTSRGHFFAEATLAFARGPSSQASKKYTGTKQPTLATQARVPQTNPVGEVARGTPRASRARPVDAPCKKWGFVQLYRYFSGFYTIPHPAVQARKRPTTALAATTRRGHFFAEATLAFARGPSSQSSKKHTGTKQ